MLHHAHFGTKGGKPPFAAPCTKVCYAGQNCRSVTAKGDTLILYSAKALGRKPARAGVNMADIETDGVTVGTINVSAVSEMIWELNFASRRAA